MKMRGGLTWALAQVSNPIWKPSRLRAFAKSQLSDLR
jgi:hypothetical protein